MSGTLYMIPTPLGIHTEIPLKVKQVIVNLKYFIAESEKESRRFLSKCGYDLKNHYPEFYILNEHTRAEEIIHILKPLLEGDDVGLMSDAGLPAVADPGNTIVALCHQKNIRVIPLPGSSSIMFALMCSGFSGQQFRFHGYIPARNPERIQAIKRMEQECLEKNITQIFIETPYRNRAVLEDILKVGKKELRLCIALGIETDEFRVVSKPLADWNLEILKDLKIPAVFILG